MFPSIPPWMAIPAILLALLAMYVLYRRLRNPARRQGAGLYVRLGLFLLALLLLSGVVIVNVIARSRARTLLYPAHARILVAPEQLGVRGAQAVRFPTPDGFELGGWYLPTRNGATVIGVHGYGGTRIAALEEALPLYEQGFGLLVYDSRAAGESNGRLNSFGLYEVNDVRGALAFLAARPEVDPQRIGLMGHSVGGATAILAGAQIPEIRAVAALSPYATLKSIMYSAVEQILNLPGWLFGPLIVGWGEYETGLDIDAVRPLDHIAQIAPRPLLLVYGEQDTTVVPAENADPLYAAAGQPKRLLLLPHAGHANLARDGGPAYRQALVEFFTDGLAEK